MLALNRVAKKNVKEAHLDRHTYTHTRTHTFFVIGGINFKAMTIKLQTLYPELIILLSKLSNV